MAIRHACFVSYCHGHGELMQRFVNEFVDSLSSTLDAYMDRRVYIDQDRLNYGSRYEGALAEAICQSLCMVAIFVPKYLEHDYCRRELHAMHLIEERRRVALGAAAVRHHGYVIPVVLRGEIAGLPSKIKSHVHACDFSGFTTASPRIADQAECMDRVENIAKFVYDLHTSLRDIGDDCSSFSLPTTADAEEWKPAPRGSWDPQPLREADR
jgi:hypothetical protein